VLLCIFTCAEFALVQILKRESSIVALYSTYTRVLTFENLYQKAMILKSQCPSICTKSSHYGALTFENWNQEAMHCRSLEADELLNVRWAYDDPNPKVTEYVVR
jgi:hypothetical protein